MGQLVILNFCFATERSALSGRCVIGSFNSAKVRFIQQSRSVIKDSMSKMAALGQSIGGMFPSDEIVKGSISGYVFEQFEIACYTSLLAAAEKAGDTASIPAIEAILAEEQAMADWLIKHIPQTTEQFLLRSDADGVEAKK